MVKIDEAYTIFLRIVNNIKEQVRKHTYNNGEQLAEYAPEEWYSFAQYYSVKFYKDGGHRYFALIYWDVLPVCYVNEQIDNAAYILTAAFVESVNETEDVELKV